MAPTIEKVDRPGKPARSSAPKTSKPKRRKEAQAPRKAQSVPGYGELITLAHDSGQVVSINAQVVYRNDHFDYAYGLSERLEHVPAAGERGEITHFYAYARLKDGGHHFDVMSKAEMDAVRARGKAESAWVSGYVEMGRTTVLLRIARFLPFLADELEGIAIDPPEAATPAPPEADGLLKISEPRQTIPEIEPEGVELTEEEFFALLPPLHILHILDAVAEREMPEKVLEEIIGKPLDEVTGEEEKEILRAIALWQP